MSAFMAYATLISVAIAASVAVADRALRWGRRPARGVWMIGLVGVLAATMVAFLLPPVTAEETASPATTMGLRGAAPSPSSVGSGDPAIVAVLDEAILPAWIIASMLLLMALGIGQWRVRRERREATVIHLFGHPVYLNRDHGPAVAGVTDPFILMPRWVLSLEGELQRLLLAHEVEHVRARDTALLTAGAVCVALMPWNPAVWWINRRLRVAIELDCDARVLATHPDPHRYADLLLVAASRPALTTRLLAAHFGELATDLERRIEAMTSQTAFRSLIAPTAVATLLVVMACQAPRPRPTPELSVPAPGVTTSATYQAAQVERQVTMAPGSVMPRYPESLRNAGVQGEARVSVVVDESGRADMSTFRVISSTHELFAEAVRNALPAMRFNPAHREGRPVRQVIEEPFTFSVR